MASSELSLPTALNYIMSGLKDELQARVKSRLLEVIQPILDQEVRKICSDLSGHIASYHDHESGDLNILVQLNGVNLK